jgi:hypothetical protein
LQHLEHRSFALELAKAWMELADYEARKKPAQIEAPRVVTAADGTILIIAEPETDRPPGEQID